MKRKKLEELKRALIIIDMVNGFTREGNMANKYMTNIIAENVKLVKEFLKTGDLVIATKEAHNQSSVEFKDYPEHCIEGTDEAQLVPELKVYEQYFEVFSKNSTCIAVAPKYIELIKKLINLEEVILIGGCTDICLMQAAIPTKCLFNQLDRNVKVIVPKNAVDTYDAPWHNRDEWNEMAFRFMNQAGIETPDVYKKEMR
jgi:nicotinamidase-related amidase